MRWTVLLIATSMTACSSGSPAVSADNLAERYSTFAIDDNIGIGCASYETERACGKSTCSASVTGPCFLAASIPNWLGPTERATFTLTDVMSSVVVDDTNGLVCIGVAGEITTCFAQRDLVPAGVAALRARTLPWDG